MEEDLHLQGSFSLRIVMMPGIVPRKRGFDRKDSNNAWDCSRKSGFHIVSNTAMSFHSSIDLVGFFPIRYHVRFFTSGSICWSHGIEQAGCEQCWMDIGGNLEARGFCSLTLWAWLSLVDLVGFKVLVNFNYLFQILGNIHTINKKLTFSLPPIRTNWSEYELWSMWWWGQISWWGVMVL